MRGLDVDLSRRGVAPAFFFDDPLDFCDPPARGREPVPPSGNASLPLSGSSEPLVSDMLPASLLSRRRAARLSEADGFLLGGGDMGGDDQFTGGGPPELIRAVSLFGARFCFWSDAAGTGFSAEPSGFGGTSRTSLGNRPVGCRSVVGRAFGTRGGGASNAAEPSTCGFPL